MNTHEGTVMHAYRTAALLAAATLTAGLVTAVPAHATPSGTGDRVRVTTVDPATLARGSDPSVPHADRGWFVAGDVRVKLGKYATYLGRSGSAWIVAGYRARTNVNEIVRVERDGSTTVLRRGVDASQAVVSKDGSRLYTAKLSPKTRRTIFRVFDATTGERTSRRVLSGYAQLLAATRNRAYLSDDALGTYTLNSQGKRRRAVSSERAVLVDLRNDLMQTFTGDPYQNGCARVVRVSDPTDEVWKSCAERVEAFNTDGTAFATVDLLSDGIGPGLVQTRLLDGTLTGRYTTNWFGTIGWESPDTLLVVANGPTKAALVRCTDEVCENAGDPYRTPQLRTAAARQGSPLVLRSGRL